MGVDFSTRALDVAFGPVEADHPFLARLHLHGATNVDVIVDAVGQFGTLLDRLNARHRFDLGLLAIERPFLQRNQRSAIVLSQLQGAVIGVAHERRWFPVQEDPSAIRKAVLGVGSSRVKGEMKRVANEYVQGRYGQEVDLDTSDSIVCWDFARHLSVRIEEPDQP